MKKVAPPVVLRMSILTISKNKLKILRTAPQNVGPFFIFGGINSNMLK